MRFASWFPSSLSFLGFQTPGTGGRLRGVRRSRRKELLRLVRRSGRSLLAWPLLCLVLGISLWGTILLKLEQEHKALSASAASQAATLSKTYAAQLTRSVEQIDQITLSLKYYWQRNRGKLNLEDQLRHGLFPKSPNLYVTVFDRRGRVVASTWSAQSKGDEGDTNWFRQARLQPSNGLTIVEPAMSPRLNRVVVRFLRGLETPNGMFDGVVSVSVEPAYLASFSDETTFGKANFVAVSTTKGDLLAARVGHMVLTQPDLFPGQPPHTGHGVIALEGGQFGDGHGRITAWHTLEGYPLVSLVGLAQQDIDASFRELRRSYRGFAVTASLLLTLAALSGMAITLGLARRRQQAEDLRTAYYMAIDGAREGFYLGRAIYSRDGLIEDFMIEDCNERGASMMGRKKEDLVGARFSAVFSGMHAERGLNILRKTMETGFHEDEVPVLADSPIKAIWLHRKLVRSGNGLAVTLRDISETKQHAQALADMVNTDTLTTLPNRQWLNSYLPRALERAKKDGTHVALMFVDLDDFKNINDTLGHAAGDELLQAAALRLRAVIRPNDCVVRLGGDEFTIIVEKVHSQDDVCHVAERVIQTLGNPFSLGGASGTSSHTVHASVGISLYPDDGDDAKTLLKHADIAMYAAKANGKGCFQFFQQKLSEQLLQRLNTEQALRRALDNDEFLLHYQPRVDTFSGELRGLEALVRWQPPDGALIPPNEFIPIAEDTGLIARLGDLVIEKACAQLAAWRALGLPVTPVSINVSARQFDHGKVSATFDSCLTKNGLAPELIEIEVTESSMIGEHSVVANELAALQELGITLHIDDFGTGYSSLSQLQRLQFDVLKVDRSFTAHLCSGKEGDAFFMAILSMAHVLGMRVVAEGVETAEQLRVLQELSCNEVQGYFISRPVPASDVPALLKRRFLFPDVQPSLRVI